LLLLLFHGSLGGRFLILIPWVCEIGTRNRGKSSSRRRRRRRRIFFFYKAVAVRYHHQCFLEVVGVGMMMMIPVAAAGPEAQLKRLGNEDAHVHEDEAEQKHTHAKDADQRKPPHLHIAAYCQTLPAYLPKTSTTTRLAKLLLPQLHHHNFSHSVPNTLRCLLVCKPPNSLTHTRIPTIYTLFNPAKPAAKPTPPHLLLLLLLLLPPPPLVLLVVLLLPPLHKTHNKMLWMHIRI